MRELAVASLAQRMNPATIDHARPLYQLLRISEANPLRVFASSVQPWIDLIFAAAPALITDKHIVNGALQTSAIGLAAVLQHRPAPLVAALSRDWTRLRCSVHVPLEALIRSGLRLPAEALTQQLRAGMHIEWSGRALVLIVQHGALAAPIDTPVCGAPLLCHAARFGEGVPECLVAGANPNAVDCAGCTALHWLAASTRRIREADKSHLESLTQLLRAGADPDARTPDGLTPLMLLTPDSPGLVKVLVGASRALHYPNPYGDSVSAALRAKGMPALAAALDSKAAASAAAAGVALLRPGRAPGLLAVEEPREAYVTGLAHLQVPSCRVLLADHDRVRGPRWVFFGRGSCV
jgi:hypothetical protein